MFCTRTTNCCVRRPPSSRPSSVVASSRAREAVKWDLNHDVAVVVRPRRSFFPFTSTDQPTDRPTVLSPAPPPVRVLPPSSSPLLSLPRLRDQQHLSCFPPRKKGLLCSAVQIGPSDDSLVSRVHFFCGRRKEKEEGGREEKGQIRGIHATVGIAVMGRIQCHIVIPCSRSF